MIIIARFKSFSSLQDIVDITLEKICKVGSLENKLVESDGAGYVAQLKVGSDGMTSNSNYNMKLPDENFADSNIVATDLVDDEIGIDNDFDETEFYFNQIVENFSKHLQINSGEHCIGKPNLE